MYVLRRTGRYYFWFVLIMWMFFKYYYTTVEERNIPNKKGIFFIFVSNILELCNGCIWRLVTFCTSVISKILNFYYSLRLIGWPSYHLLSIRNYINFEYVSDKYLADFVLVVHFLSKCPLLGLKLSVCMCVVYFFS